MVDVSLLWEGVCIEKWKGRWRSDMVLGGLCGGNVILWIDGIDIC